MIALWLAACGTPAPQPGVPDPTVNAGFPDADLGTEGSVPGPDPVFSGRPPRRMDIAQLDASIRAVTGGIGWDDGDDNQFEALASTLGVPDYAESTLEDRTPGLLFHKFLDDAANAVCHELLDAEVLAEPADRVFLVHVEPEVNRNDDPAAVDANLSMLLLRYHGEAVAPDAPQLQLWSTLFQATVDATGGDTTAGWRAVCIGLIIHPNFTMY